MKKVLLLTASAFCVLQAAAIEPTMLNNVTINNLSPNGKWGVSSAYEMVIFDFENDKQYVYAQDPDDPDQWDTSYSSGSSSCISNNGIVVGSVTMDSGAYWANGEWTLLKASCAIEKGTILPMSITPDGNRIVGLASIGKMSVPGYWEANGDGTYGDFKQLPYPALDFTNRTPQYVSANSISDDGKIIVGQVTDNFGSWHYPIIYRENEKGEWSYTVYHQELLNPTNVEFPSADEILDEVEWPDPMSYMTESQLAAYNEAVENYDYESGDPYPMPENFLEGEQLAEYMKAVGPYKEWFDQLGMINSGLEKMATDGGYSFVFNNVWLSGDGKTLAMTVEKTIPSDDPYSFGNSVTYPCIFDLENDEYKIYEGDLNLLVSFIGKDGGVLASTYSTGATYPSGYIMPAGASEFMPLEKYVASISSETAEWMKDNMTHSCQVGMDEEYAPIFETVMVTGLPTATADLTTFATWTETGMFEECINGTVPEDYPYMISYMFTIDNPAGVTSPVVAGEGVSVSVEGGLINISGDAVSLAIYDLNGRVVLSVANPASVVDPALASGFYIVKAYAADGSSVTVKAAF